MYQGVPSCAVSSSNHKLSLPKQASHRIGSIHDSIKTDHCRIITILVASFPAPNSVSTYVNRASKTTSIASRCSIPANVTSICSPNPRTERLLNDFIMAGHGHHSFNGPPKPPVAHVPRIYRFTATALGAGMWFFVSQPRRIRF